MFFSQQKLTAFSEADLRKEVLIPLFQAMGFQDVVEYHGSDEFGKDIVMWQRDVLRGRINFAVVAKSKNITGSVSKGHISEVCIQVRQCFGQPFVDPIDSSQQTVDRVIIVTSGSITRPARKAIQVELDDSKLASRVDVIDGDILWSRIREYMPNAVLWDHLDRARRLINEQAGDHELTMQISRESTSIFASPRSDMAEPVRGTLGVEFLNTIEGLAKKAEYLNHFRTGQPVLITKEPAAKIEVTLPDFIKNLAPEGEITHLYLGPPQAMPPQPHRLVVEGREGALSIFEYIEFSRQAGREQVTLSNKRQPIPFKFELILSGTSIQFKFNFDVEECNVVQGLRALLFKKALSEGAKVKLLDWESDLVELEFETESGHCEAPDPAELHCFAALVFIQGKLGIPFTTKPLNNEQCAKIILAASALQSGRAIIPEAALNLSDLSERSDFGPWEDLVGQPLSVPVNFGDYKLTILDQEISLGPANVLCRGLVIEKLVNGTRIFFLRAAAESPFLAEFSDWLNVQSASEEPPGERASEDHAEGE